MPGTAPNYEYCHSSFESNPVMYILFFLLAERFFLMLFCCVVFLLVAFTALI